MPHTVITGIQYW